jgi:hypothetical protein
MSIKNFEVDLNKLLMTAVLGLLGWNLATTQELKTDVAVLTEVFNIANGERVSVADNALLNERLRVLETTVQELKNDRR